MSNQDGGDGEPSSARKRGRGPTTLPNLDRIEKEVEFDKYGRYNANAKAKKYPSHLGKLVKNNVPISYRTWEEVPEKIKLQMWQDIKVWNDFFSFQLYILTHVQSKHMT